jgi:anaerobic magnesium-protoporphyrin IX monomethyl ester cyclase
MIDLRTLRDKGSFSINAGPPRLALVHHGFRTTQFSFADKRKARFAARFSSLGLLNLARSLQVDHEQGRLPFAPEFRYFDEDCYADDNDLVAAVVEWLRPASARFVLAGLYSLAFDRTANMLALIDPSELCVVVGCAPPTVAPHFDYAHLVVRGEGGRALQHILTQLFEPTFGQGPEARGICFQLDGELHMSGPAFDNSLATIPPPAFAYELSESRDEQTVRPQVQWWKAVSKSPQIYVCTQSCRARCTFCSTYLIHGRAVSRPVEFIAADLDYIKEFGHDSIQFHDDDLLQHDQFDQLMDVLAEKNLLWTCNARSEFMDAARAKQMFAAGCRKVFLGVESLDQRSLDYYRKATTVEMNQTAVRELDAAGIGVVCGYIIGAPHDTVESILEDIDRVLELPILFLATAILTPDIGTVEFLRARKRDSRLRMLGDDGTVVNIRPRPDLFGSEQPYGLPTVSEAVSKSELNELYIFANCAFFLRESSIERILRMTPPDRVQEVWDWIALYRSRAEDLARSARLDVVRRRASALVARYASESASSPERVKRA